ncbi:MAG: hypothetical protein WCO07_01420 [bacterium]
MTKHKGLEKLISEKESFDQESRAFIDSLVLSEKHIGEINNMKRTAGWKILEQKIREELHERIFDMVKDDLKIQTLLALLKVADTKSLTKILDEEIENIIPN